MAVWQPLQLCIYSAILSTCQGCTCCRVHSVDWSVASAAAVRLILSGFYLKRGNLCFAQKQDASFPNVAGTLSQDGVISQGRLENFCTMASIQLTLYRMKRKLIACIDVSTAFGHMVASRINDIFIFS